MGRSRFIPVVAVLCALALAAVAASGAGAATAVETGNTAFTCKNIGQNAGAHRFTDEDCSVVNDANGTFFHVSIAENEVTELHLTKLNNPQLKVKIAGVNTTLTATGVNCLSCVAKDQKDSTTGVMDVTGSGGEVEFTGVTTNVTNCGVEGTPGGPGKIITKPLKLTTLSPTKVTLEPVTGTIVAEFDFVDSGGTCPLVPTNPIKIEGHADGTLNGAKVTFNTVAGMLNDGSQTAFLTGEVTVSGRLNGTQGFTALSLTAA